MKLLKTNLPLLLSQHGFDRALLFDGYWNNQIGLACDLIHQLDGAPPVGGEWYDNGEFKGVLYGVRSERTAIAVMLQH